MVGYNVYGTPLVSFCEPIFSVDPIICRVYTRTVRRNGFMSTTPSCFINSPTDHNWQRILTYEGSKDVVWRKDVPFGYPKC